ncbi:MAG: adenylosuccinate synthetase [Cyanobacteriota bacterium]
MNYSYNKNFKNIILEKLEKIRNKYVFYRMKELNIDISEKFQSLLESNEIIERFMEDLEFILKKTTMTDFKLLDEYDDVIFEGAQGLLLDQNNELFFPHLTRSNTGITNINSIVNEYCNNFKTNVKDEIIYITRCYSTRHGAGKFNTELSEKPYKKIEDITNITNNYQGSIRFGWLDIDLLSESIKKDIKNKSNNDCISLGITCLDQIDDKENTTYIYKGKIVTSSIDVFLERIKVLTGINNLYLSYGNTREDIKLNKN